LSTANRHSFVAQLFLARLLRNRLPAMNARWKYAEQALSEIFEAADMVLWPRVLFEVLSLGFLEKCCRTENVGIVVQLQRANPHSKHYISSLLNRIWINREHVRVRDDGREDRQHRTVDVTRQFQLEILGRPSAIFSSTTINELMEYLLEERGAFNGASRAERSRLRFAKDWMNDILAWLPRARAPPATTNQYLSSVLFNVINKQLDDMGYQGPVTNENSRRREIFTQLLLAFLDMFPGNFFPYFTTAEMNKTNSNQNDTLILYGLRGRSERRYRQSMEALELLERQRRQARQVNYPNLNQDEYNDIQERSNDLAMSWLETFIANQFHIMHRMRYVNILEQEPEHNGVYPHTVAGMYRLDDDVLRQRLGGQRQMMFLRPEDRRAFLMPGAAQHLDANNEDEIEDFDDIVIILD